jgi:hypothetical protein
LAQLFDPFTGFTAYQNSICICSQIILLYIWFITTGGKTGLMSTKRWIRKRGRGLC